MERSILTQYSINYFMGPLMMTSPVATIHRRGLMLNVLVRRWVTTQGIHWSRRGMEVKRWKRGVTWDRRGEGSDHIKDHEVQISLSKIEILMFQIGIKVLL